MKKASRSFGIGGGVATDRQVAIDPNPSVVGVGFSATRNLTPIHQRGWPSRTRAALSQPLFPSVEGANIGTNASRDVL